MSNEKSSSPKGRFGTFTGVFTPNVLTILGIILFLRVGWVVGQSGLIGSLAIILIANTISLLTGLSLSAVATNMRVKTGGAYYMISRTLGLSIGGAIGIPLYLSQAISVAFYIIGFTEAFVTIFPGWDQQLISTLIALIFGFLAFIGADFALRIQFVILAALGLAIASFFMGGWEHWSVPASYLAPAQSTASFWQVFSIFFPAVTGITVGLSMSGDLKDPAKSLPRGTLSAIALTGLIYCAFAVWLATHASTTELLLDNMVVKNIARWPLLIIAGVWASTLSSALGSVLAAPRTLQAISMDKVIPKIFRAQLKSPTEPRLAVLVTTGIALMVIWMGNLDFVAPIITMFFLNTYGMINLTAGLERLVGNPSFRPQFNVPWPLSIVGALGCYGAMFLISAPATVIAILVSYGIYALLSQRELAPNWGDIRSGIWFTVARFSLMRLENAPYFIRNWRPNIMVLTGAPHSREELNEAGSWLTSGRGIVTFYHLLVGNVDELAERGVRETSIKHMRKYFHELGVSAFAESSVVPDFYEGVLAIMQSHGIAGVEPNVALLGWADDPDAQRDQLQLMWRLAALKKSTMFLHFDEEREFGQKKRIDVWWRGRDRNGELMLLMAHLIGRSRPWDSAKIRVLRVPGKRGGQKGRGGTHPGVAEVRPGRSGAVRGGAQGRAGQFHHGIGGAKRERRPDHTGPAASRTRGDARTGGNHRPAPSMRRIGYPDSKR